MKIDNFIEGSLREEQQLQNLSEGEYDKVFSRIEKEITQDNENIRSTRAIEKIKKIVNGIKTHIPFKGFIQVTAFILVLILVPVLATNYSRSNKKATNPSNPAVINGQGDTNIKYDGFDQVIIADTPLYEKAEYASKQINKFTRGMEVMAEKAVKDKNGIEWTYVDSSLSSLFDKNGYVIQANSLAEETAILPNKLSDLSGDKASLGMYIAYCAELSKAQGYDLKNYLGKTVTCVSGEIVRKDNLSESYNFVVLLYNKEICGAWIENPNYNTKKSVELLSLDGKDFDSIVKDKQQWLTQNGLSLSMEEFQKILDKNRDDNKNPLIFKLIKP